LPFVLILHLTGCGLRCTQRRAPPRAHPGADGYRHVGPRYPSDGYGQCAHRPCPRAQAAAPRVELRLSIESVRRLHPGPAGFWCATCSLLH